MASTALLQYMVDNFGPTDLRAFAAQAFQAAMSQATEVTITSASFPEGGSASGEWQGDPSNFLECAQKALAIVDPDYTPTEIPAGDTAAEDGRIIQLSGSCKITRT